MWVVDVVAPTAQRIKTVLSPNVKSAHDFSDAVAGWYGLPSSEVEFDTKIQCYVHTITRRELAKFTQGPAPEPV